MNEQQRKSMVHAAINKATKLIEMERGGSLDKIAKDKRSVIEAQMSGADIEPIQKSVQMPQQPTQMQMQYRMSNQESAASKVPSIIRESFMNNPIDDSELYKAFGDQGDGRSLEFLTNGITESAPRQQVQQQPTQVAQGGIDYSVIRSIVEESVRKYTSSLGKKLLSEGKQGSSTVSTIALGETFKFLDGDGNIYECKMKKVGNIKNKTKRSVNE